MVGRYGCGSQHCQRVQLLLFNCQVKFLLVCIFGFVLAGCNAKSNWGNKVLYGDDDRTEVYEAIDDYEYGELFEELSSATVMFTSRHVIGVSRNCGNDFVAIEANQYFVEFNNIDICQGERFYNQPNPGWCSGFLASDDVVVTAGHCIQSEAECEAAVLIMNFQLDSEGRKPDLDCIPENHVFYCDYVIDQKLGTAKQYDHAVIKLTERVPSYVGQPVSAHETGEVEINDDLVLVGHPYGLPKKISPGAQVKQVNPGQLQFFANVDAYSGNSGSLVASLTTGNVVGILVAGNSDFQLDGQHDCYTSNRCGDIQGCQYDSQMTFEAIAKTDAWEIFLPEFEGLSLNYHGRIFIATSDDNASERILEVIVSNSADQEIDYQATLEFKGIGQNGVRFENDGVFMRGSVNGNDEETFEVHIMGGHVAYEDVFVTVHDELHEHDRLFDIAFISVVDILAYVDDESYWYTEIEGDTIYTLDIRGQITNVLEREYVFSCATAADGSNIWDERHTIIYEVEFTNDVELTIDTLHSLENLDTLLAISTDVDAEKQLFDCNDNHPLAENYKEKRSYLTGLQVQRGDRYFIFVSAAVGDEVWLSLSAKRKDFFEGASDLEITFIDSMACGNLELSFVVIVVVLVNCLWGFV